MQLGLLTKMRTMFSLGTRLSFAQWAWRPAVGTAIGPGDENYKEMFTKLTIPKHRCYAKQRAPERFKCTGTIEETS